MAGGSYVLLVELARDATVEVGALGARTLSAGWYAYVGSALGRGGFARVDRHRELAAGGRDARHWHVDYLLGHAASALEGVRRYPGRDAECALARGLGADLAAPVTGFGASDCDCGSHLFAAPDRARLESALSTAEERLG